MKYRGWNRLLKTMTMPFEITDIGENGKILNQTTNGIKLFIRDCDILLYDEYSQLTQGDIVEKVYEMELVGGNIMTGEPCEKMIEHKDVGVVVFEKGAFGIKWNMYSKVMDIEFFCRSYYFGNAPFYKKIGNIYENPELLK